jgi:3-phenylpropionate/trans-cinnamate dioxygenase ferredoxin subunit
MASFVRVASKSEIPEGSAKCVEVGIDRIAIFHVGGSFYAIDDDCTHAGGPLSEGEIEGDEVVCPLHGSCFKITTGEALNPPASASVATYSVRLNGDDIEVEI